MMKKSYCIISVVAFAWCLLATSCTKEQNFQDIASDQFSSNFKALVMGSKSIDPNQDWSTVGTIPVEVKVDMGDSKEYTVYIFHTPPVLDDNAGYIGMVRLNSGESKTINVAKPAKAGLLYAACYDSDSHAFCKWFVAKDSGCKVTFSGKSVVQTGTRSVSTGNRWSVPITNLPDLTKYTTGNLIEMTDQENITGIGDSSEKHLVITKTFNGIINRLNTYANQSVYVLNTWTLTYDQRVTNGSIIIVGKGGKIVVPKGFKLTSNPQGEDDTYGMVYVMEGGVISGEGTVEFATSTDSYCYNGGIISAKNIQLNGGTLFNSGLLGDEKSPTTVMTGSNGTNGYPGTLINHGLTKIAETEGNSLSIFNAGVIQVTGNLTLNNETRMDDASYTECAKLTLNGNNSKNHVLYMGNGAYLNCKGDISIDNFGVWGPSGNGYKSNAIFKIKNCTYCKTTEGAPSTYLLDHVELVLPTSYPTIFDNGAIREWDSDIKSYGIGTLSETFSGYYDIRLFYEWMNAGKGLLDVSNYNWTIDGYNKYNYLWSDTSMPYDIGVDEDRMTCFYSDGPSYSLTTTDYTGNHHLFQKEVNYTPETNWLYYAFEIADSNNDFNYNDVILQVGTPNDNGDGTYTSTVQVACVGTTLSTTVLYDGENFGDEIHVALGTSTTANTSKINRKFRKLDTITFNSSDFRLDKLPFTLHIVNSNNVDNQFSYMPQILNGTPSFIVVNGDGAKKWFWTKESMNIGLAYPLFGTWGSDMTKAPDWYNSKNADTSKIVSW